MKAWIILQIAKLTKNWGPIREWWNKDVRGAAMIIGTLLVIGWLLFGCASVDVRYMPTVQFGFGVELDNDKPVVGRNPVGVGYVNQPVWVNSYGNGLHASYLHLSSVPDVADLGTVDQFNLLYSHKFGASRQVIPAFTKCESGSP